MYMCVRPDSRSARYQAVSAAGIQRQSGMPANHKFAATDNANSAVTHNGAAFIMMDRSTRRTQQTLAPSRLILKPEDLRPGNAAQRRSFTAAMADVVTERLKHALDAERRIEPRSNVRVAWEELVKESRTCTRCDLYKYATQTVFGEGPLDAQIVFVGEQPG